MNAPEEQRLIEKLRRIESLWPEFTELDRTLQQYLTEETNRVIAESIHRDTSDVEVRTGQALPAGTPREEAGDDTP